MDVFSVGIILYILLSLQNPFFDGDPDNLLKNNMQCKIDFNMPVEISSFTMDLLKKMLAKRPSERLSA